MDLKKYFPYLTTNSQEVYFDSAATALKPKAVLDAEYDYNVKIAANTHNNLFDNAHFANVMLSETRELTRKFIGASKSEEIIFTSGTTHALNQLAFGLKKILTKTDEVVLTKLEHSSNLLPWMVLAQEIGFTIKYLELDGTGAIDVLKIKNTITSNTKIVSFASVSNTLAAWNDVKIVTKTIKNLNPQALVIVDAAQSVAHDHTDVTAWDVDAIAFSAHKMFGPFGLGVLWAKTELLKIMEPIFYGGGNNSAIEFDKFSLAKIPEKFEAGTLNLSAIYGFKASIEFINTIGMQVIIDHGRDLKKYLRTNLKQLDQNQFEFYNLESDQPIFLFNVKGVHAQDFGAFLNKNYHISVRVGKHCARLAKHVHDSESTVRASFSIFNTTKDLDVLIEALKHADEWIDAIL